VQCCARLIRDVRYEHLQGHIRDAHDVPIWDDRIGPVRRLRGRFFILKHLVRCIYITEILRRTSIVFKKRILFYLYIIRV